MILPPTHPALRRLSTADLVFLCYIVSTGISELRWTVPGAMGLDLLRAEFARREQGGA